ncbi:LysR family transcriptional regulator [Dermabacteraceae bacterium TAE3-ERU27]|nr:LysR family transcriptional regulator [Dermabacteraceae bacterium TAE3-ERU27]
MDPRRLLIFRTVVRQGSIGAGARELGLTQPAVSQHLAALEKEVDTQLLLRSSSGITPTEAGQCLFHHAETIAATLRAAQDELADITALCRGTVRFATFPSAAAVLLPPAIQHIAKTAPGVEVSFDELEPAEAISALLAGDIDVAMIFRYTDTDISTEGTLEWIPLFEDEVMLVLPADDPRAASCNLELSAFANDPWIAGCARCRSHLLKSAVKAGFEPNIRHSTDDYHVIQRLISHGAGVALLPGIAREAYCCTSVAFRSVPELEKRTIGLLARPGALRIPAVAALVSALTEEAKVRVAEREKEEPCREES